MKLKRNTWFLVALALTLGVVVYISETQWTPKQEEEQAEQKPIFDLEEKEIQAIILEKDGEETLEFVRTGKQEQIWQMKQPEDLPASDAAVSFLLSFLANGKRKRTFTISPEQKSDYGLENSLAKITIKLEPGKNRELVLGLPNLDNQFVYALIDAPNGNETELEVSLVPIGLKYAVEKELEQWKQKEEAVDNNE